MDEEIERLVVSVRADVQGFASDVGAMGGLLQGPLAQGAEQAGSMIESTLMRAVRTGKLGFEDLRRVAMAAMAEIAQSAISSGIGSLFGGGGGGGLIGSAGTILSAALGLPGGATGGPVSPGRAYMVGERGPELFVPTASGQVMPNGAAPARDVRVTVNVNAGQGGAPEALARSSRQVARAVRRALEG
ncbi:tail tape measure protein [Rhizorhapis suberifaciens]|uniref:Phage-related minor tail protein n=1 Tax=Rhizorhapis suberifaciens TaxID=13656 RepID=A0A840HVW4_9SPHN|nr:tail tape measure protein [Rhizorhapis suberifaciens]MBB4641729.1 phage-related minor tail protein [Rhizorhapis suberifaciens]